MTQWKYFSPEELECKCDNPDCDGGQMKASFMERLVKLREHLGFPLPVSSAFRCSKHNYAVGGADGSYHCLGQAVDIEIGYDRAYKVVEAARKFGFYGVGVSQKGKKRFIHLDNRPQTEVAFWSY